MSKPNGQKILQLVVVIISIGLMIWAAPELMERFGLEIGKSDNDAANYIVLGQDLLDVSSQVLREGGVITHSMPHSSAVAARLTTRQIKALLNSEGIMGIYENRSMNVNRIASAGIISGRS